MLRSLHIRNYILIDSLDVSFPEGLIIITGQTGAGKSIILGAMSLLFGAKADASMVAQGEDSCVVEAEFDTGTTGHLTIRRVVNASGRSRSFINDCPVQVAALQALADKLIDIHSQHKSILLTDKKFQLSVLDRFADDREELMACRRLWGELSALEAEIRTKRARIESLKADRDYVLARLGQLEQAKLVSGELESLEEEHKSLANAEQIMDSLSKASALISGSDDSEFCVSASLKEVCRSLEHISSCLSKASGLASRLDSARLEIDDVSSEIDGLLSSVNLSPGRLEEVEDRMSLLYSLLRKFSCSTVDELIAMRDSYSSSISGTQDLEEELSVLEDKASRLRAQYNESCMALSAVRHSAAPELSDTVRESVHFLELEGADFEVRVEDADPGASGSDKVSFLFSANGGVPEDLSKVASGGELSRIMLSIKSVMAKFAGMPTLIFDEIDTGVSGSVADKMGRMICSMGKTMQVFSITHLPQVAAKGNAHFIVSKSTREDGRVISTMRQVNGDERVREIARLLSGSSITDAALANARELLSED